MSSPDSRGVARIDQRALKSNLGVVRDRVGHGVRIFPVIKAEAYGHGLWHCGRTLLDAGADGFCVATAEEAVATRELSADLPILVLGALTPRELEVAIGTGASISVWEEGFLARVREQTGASTGPVPIHLKYDTGMGRLGARDPDALIRMADLVASDPGLELTALWTHFATADEPEDRFMDDQLEKFLDLAGELRTRHPDILLHVANSAALLRESATHLDLVRPGVALYGMDPFGGDPSDHGLEPVLSLRSTVASIRTIEPGGSVGYGRTWVAGSATEVATVPLGYGDGYRRGLSGRARVLIGGEEFPVAGTVSMDNIAVDLGPPGTSGVGIGDEVVLIGPSGDDRILAEELARTLETINYEVTCGLSQRVPREPSGNG